MGVLSRFLHEKTQITRPENGNCENEIGENWGKSGKNKKLKKSISSNYASSKNAGSPEVFWGVLGPFFATGTRLILKESSSTL